jgi:hypothetical protein
MTLTCLQASLSSLFIEIYGLNELQAGLIYLPFGIGCAVAAFGTGVYAHFNLILKPRSSYQLMPYSRQGTRSSIQHHGIEIWLSSRQTKWGGYSRVSNS